MNKLYITVIVFIFTTGLLYSDNSKFDLFAYEVDVDGELRSRFAYLNEFYPDDQFLMSDMKGELSLEISNESPLYFKTLMEVGNIEFDSGFTFTDFTELEFKEYYLGYNSDFLESKIGRIDTKTPGKYVYSGEGLGTEFRFNFDSSNVKVFYTTPNLIDEELNSLDNLNNFSQMFYGDFEKESSYDYTIWTMIFNDNSQDDYDYFTGWIGWEGEKNIDKFSSDFGFTYNFGSVTSDDNDYDISAYYLHGKAEYQSFDSISFFTRLNITSGDNEMTDAVNQFQVVDGNLDTSLGLLFGGSPYSSISYFSDDSLSIYSDNLSNGTISLTDPGLIVYEFGASYESESLPYEAQFAIGGASTSQADSISDSSFIGVEFDLHNKYKINDAFSVALSLAYFIPGDGITYIYYTNEGDLLDGDNSFKLDCSFTLKL